MSNVEKYFQDPHTMDISGLLKLIDNINFNVKDMVDCEYPRVRGKIEEPYEKYLERQKLQQKSRELEEVFREISSLFKGAIRWHCPGTMINVNPPANLGAIAISSYAHLFNPNFAQDMSTGGLALAELEVTKYLCDLAEINWKKAMGVFTFGGKGTNLYAIKIGLEKCMNNADDEGIKNNVFTITTEQGHPCHSEVCGWLGIGRKNSIAVPVDGDGIVIIEEAEKIIAKELEKGRRLACITINGATTIQMTIDPVKEIAQMRDRLVEKFQLDYQPHIHLDSVIGWVYLFFKNYDFIKNPLQIRQRALNKIKKMYNKISEVKYADSFSADFHKTGFCPYLSSIFVTKNREEIYKLGGSKVKTLEMSDLEYGNYSPFLYTLELSRSSSGPLAALVTLKSFGIEGFQEIIGELMNMGEYMKEKINEDEQYEVINGEDSDGFVTLFIIKPKGYTYTYDEIVYSKGMTKEDSEYLAKYNHNFYLYLLEKQMKRESTFAMDYSTGYRKNINGVRIGVLKAYPMSPFLHKEEVDSIVDELHRLKDEFDKVKDTYKPRKVPHKPRDFVFR